MTTLSMGQMLPVIEDQEGERAPDGLPAVIDAHVHLFPDSLFEALWSWFHQFAWPVRYRLTSHEIIGFLQSRGVERIVGLHYAHRPGMARQLNRHMVNLCGEFPCLTGTATVFPGEDGAADIMREAFDMGLAGLKLHAHVQYFSMDEPAMHEIYEVCSSHRKPLIMHVGTEPRNPHYPYERDPYEICGAAKLEPVLKQYRELRVCVPHLGAGEFDKYCRLLNSFDNLWVDTAMVFAEYLPCADTPVLSEWRKDRVMYGTDFPMLPYAWDREIRKLAALDLPDDYLQGLFSRNALEFLSIRA